MSPRNKPQCPSALDSQCASTPQSAAEHCVAAEELFAQAKRLHPRLKESPDPIGREYERCMEWAKLHLQLADSINVGTNLILAQRHHLDTGSRPLHEPYVRYEVEHWIAFLRVRH